MTRFLACSLALLALTWSAFGSVVAAQSVEIRGVVRDSASGNPVSGAVVLAMDAVGTTMARTITNARGQYRLSKPAGALLIRTIHIGYRATTERFPTIAADALTIDLILATLPRELQAMQVTAARGCPSRADEAQAFALLDQARAGLLATVVARERVPAQLLVLRYERFLDVDGVEAVRQTVHVDSSQNATTSFNAVRNAVDFVAAGFRSGTVGQYTYYGPDAEVLLDERFQRGYCFSLAAADTARRSQVGLRFTAANKRDGRVDIDGTLWIDTSARSLHDIAFRYVGVEPLAESFNAGGSVGFVTLPNGIPFIDRWSLRLVGGSDDADARASSQVYEIREVGGELARAKWPDGETWLGAQSSVHLTASTRDGVPARSAVLNLVDTDYRATTDSAGRATIPYVLPGPYTVAQDDATLKPIGLQIPAGRSLLVTRGSSPITRVTLPTPVQHIGAMCGATTPSKNESWLVARVMGTDGKPVGGVHWRASREDNGRWRVFSENGITASDGLILLCKGIERESRIEVAAWRDPKDAVRTQRTVNEPLSVMRIALPTATVVAAAKPKGNNNAALTVSGSVHDSATGALVADARVTFVGTPFEGSTDVSGLFVVGGLTAGDYTVEVSTPSLDSIGVVSRTVVSLTSTTPALSLFAPSLSAILTSACGAADATGFVVGSVARRGNAAMPEGMRVVAEWEENIPDSVKTRTGSKSGVRTAWRSAEIGGSGTYRLCGVPAGTRVVVRTESDSTTSWMAAPHTVSLVSDRRFARVDLQLDSTVTTLATLSGIVVADSAGTPVENVEVRLTDIDRSVLTDRRGAFRFSDLPEGAHLMSIRRVGYAPVVTPINLLANSANRERVQLDRTTILATVAVEGVFGMKEFEERRASGIGFFLTREQLDKQHGRRLGDVASQVNGFGSMMGGAGHAFAVGRRATPPPLRGGIPVGVIRGAVPIGMNRDSLPPSLYERADVGGNQTFSKDYLAEAGFYCPTAGEEHSTGIKECSCFAQVYVNGRLMNSGKPTEPFDVNSLVVDEVEGVEFYPTPASTPGRYSNLNARCGVMLIWTRR